MPFPLLAFYPGLAVKQSCIETALFEKLNLLYCIPKNNLNKWDWVVSPSLTQILWFLNEHKLDWSVKYIESQ